MNYLVTLLLVNPATGEVKTSEFECADIKVGETFLSFELEPTTTEDGYTADTVNTANFPYAHIMQFNVKKGAAKNG